MKISGLVSAIAAIALSWPAMADGYGMPPAVGPPPDVPYPGSAEPSPPPPDIGFLNIRRGPGLQYEVVIGVPSGSPDILVTPECVASDGPFPWCVVTWGYYRGWVMVDHSVPGGGYGEGTMSCDPASCWNSSP